MSKNCTVIGVDVGGTFTDVFFFDEAEGRCQVAKVPSTFGDQSQGFIEGIRARTRDFSKIATIVHGTTVGTNALLERKGVKAGIITTQGFRDVLEMRRRDRPATWGLRGSFEPVVPRDRRLEVAERTLADGTVREAVDPAEVKEAARTLLALGAESLAIVFINAHANGRNEQKALEAARAVWPNDYVNASSEILPEIREFERTSTTTLNAYLQPPIGDYLSKLEGALASGGFAGEVLIVQSNGGVMTVDAARRFPVRTALSGPAAGVIASAHIATQAGFPNVVTCDMGGTSFDVSLVANGESALAAQTSIDFGLVVRTPMIEITTIGAGGGSIARIDRGGMLKIGPESAGSYPGPVCYGLGNERPTVTDANLVLGRINAERPLGGALERLDVDAARRAIEQHIGTPLGLDALAGAEAILRVANSAMAGAIRLVSVERGHDPKNFAAMPFGGGGALHAGALMKEVGLANAVVPRFPGINSALGCTIADMRHDQVRTINGLLTELGLAELDAAMVGLAEHGRDMLARAGITFSAIENLFELDMSYLGQTHTVNVMLPLIDSGGKTSVTEEIIRHAFEARYRQDYGRPLEGIPEKILNLRVSSLGRRPKFDLALLAPDESATLEGARRQSRKVWADGRWREAQVFDRLALPVAAAIPGPAILEQPDATTFIDADLQGDVDRFGNVILTRKGAT